jgi:hypothetical protein
MLDTQRIDVLEGLVRDLAKGYRALCDDYARIGGTTAEKLDPLKDDLALIERANGYFLAALRTSPPLATFGAPNPARGLQSPASPSPTTSPR